MNVVKSQRRPPGLFKIPTTARDLDRKTGSLTGQLTKGRGTQIYTGFAHRFFLHVLSLFFCENLCPTKTNIRTLKSPGRPLRGARQGSRFGLVKGRPGRDGFPIPGRWNVGAVALAGAKTASTGAPTQKCARHLPSRQALTCTQNYGTILPLEGPGSSISVRTFALCGLLSPAPAAS